MSHPVPPYAQGVVSGIRVLKNTRSPITIGEVTTRSPSCAVPFLSRSTYQP